MDSINLTPDDSEVTVEVSIDRLWDELGNQGILNEDVEEPEYFYLAGLALECYGGEGDIHDVLMEFIRNSSAVNADLDDANEIEELLR